MTVKTMAKVLELKQLAGFQAEDQELKGCYIGDLLSRVIGKAVAEHGDGFAFAMWCGSEECEDKVKELTGLGSRCVPLDQRKISDKCVCCGKPADKMVCWGKAY